MVKVKVEEGILEGEVLDNEYGKPYYSFKGVPYAEPPVGELRFKPPKPAKPWTGVRLAKEFGPNCYQRDLFERTPPQGSEDCLYINVYSPNLAPEKPLPVMFWIHGGGYIWGSGDDNMYGPEFLIRHDVILVTFNYRLGVLGFLCLDTEQVPGNAGMKDQVLALKWVNKNISKFGGDPNNITIFGESAGGCSTSFHLVSPMSTGLFKRAIIQSGCLACFWSAIWFPREKALALARQLGCYSEDDKVLYEFFKKQPMEVLIDLNLPVTQARKPYELHLGVVSEKDFGDNERFFYGDAYDWLSGGVHENVEVIIGYTEHEGAMGLGFNAIGSLDNFFAFANDYVEYFVPKRLTMECPIIKQIEFAKQMKKFYIKDEKMSHNSIEDLIKFMNMDFFIFEIITAAKFLSQKNKTYLYKFTCKSERNQMKNIFGCGELFKDKSIVFHADDLPYLFPVKIINQNIDEQSETFQLIDNVTKLWTNFAKYGNPTPDEALGEKWVAFSIRSQDYLDIGSQIVARKTPEKQDMDFWESLYKKYLPRCIVSINLCLD